MALSPKRKACFGSQKRLMVVTCGLYYESKDEFIVSRIYRMPIYRTFSYIEEYIVSNLPYRVSRYSQNQWFFCLFFAENSKNSPKILKLPRKFRKPMNQSRQQQQQRRKFQKFAENSENLPKIPQKEGLLWGPHIVSYRIVSRKSLSLLAGGEHLTIVILQLQVGKALDSLTREGPQVENENKYYNVWMFKNSQIQLQMCAKQCEFLFWGDQWITKGRQSVPWRDRRQQAVTNNL